MSRSPDARVRCNTVAPDPRPAVDGDGRVLGGSCVSCGLALATRRPACPECRGAVSAVEFGPGGTVWAATVVRIPVAGRTPPYALAYVDLDDGPRVLAHLPEADAAPTVGSRVRLTGRTPSGDPAARLEES